MPPNRRKRSPRCGWPGSRRPNGAGSCATWSAGDTALILGHDSAAQIQPGRPFHEQGLSSLGVVELRNQLGARTGLRVPANAFFDHPTPLALVGYLEAGLADDPAPAAAEPTESAESEADVLSRAEREVLLAQEDLIDG